jgi:hypothetical protein
MRLPNINAQIIQQQTMLKHKELFAYLSKHHPQLAQELTQAYINTMRWYYLTNFSRYNQALEKIKLHAIDRNDLLGGEPASHRTGTLPINTLDNGLIADIFRKETSCPVGELPPLGTIHLR